jgi:hypothetical protein
MAYVKVFGELLDSTVWQEPIATRIVWVTMMVMSDETGFVAASVPGLARRAGVTREECDKALATFLAPDRDSRSAEFEGRRIEAVPGGWRLLNHRKYRDKLDLAERRIKDAERKKRERDRKKAADEAVTALEGDAPVTTGNAPIEPLQSATDAPPMAPHDSEDDGAFMASFESFQIRFDHTLTVYQLAARIDAAWPAGTGRYADRQKVEKIVKKLEEIPRDKWVHVADALNNDLDEYHRTKDTKPDARKFLGSPVGKIEKVYP